VVITESRPRTWPLWLLALPAFVAVWSGWVGLGQLCGFGPIQPLPGIWDSLHLDTSITLPIGMEAYAAYALRVWLSGAVSPAAVAFARRSTITALSVGAAGQIVYHLLTAAGVDHAPWPITALAATLPVAVLGMGATLAHLVQQPHDAADGQGAGLPVTHTPVTHTPAADYTPRREPVQKAAAKAAGARNPGVPAKPQSRALTAGRSARATGGDTAARVLELLTADRHLTSAAIADRVGCSERTARRHRTAALAQLDNPAEADEAQNHADIRTDIRTDIPADIEKEYAA